MTRPRPCTLLRPSNARRGAGHVGLLASSQVNHDDSVSYPVLTDDLVCGHQAQAVNDRLRNEHAVERVAVVRWQRRSGAHVQTGDLQLDKAVAAV